MFGTYQTPCWIIGDLEDGIVKIEFFDDIINDYVETEIERSKLTWA